MAYYVKKPVEIQAWPVWELLEMHASGEVKDLAALGALQKMNLTDNGEVVIETLEGAMRAQNDDYIICGVAGEYYPCKPEIFAATYAPVITRVGGS
jgi:hypothetical protein